MGTEVNKTKTGGIVATKTRRETREPSPRSTRARRSLAGQMILVFLAAIFLYGGGRAISGAIRRGREANLPPDQGQEQGPDGQDGGTVTPVNTELTDAELTSMQVNELGKVMIIMYHNIQEKEGDWIRSRDNFREDLQRFYDHGYVLIPLNDYLTGNIDLPAGKAPLVLTFDDSTKGQLTLIEQDGETIADPNCAVGILLDFSKEHPDFGHAATFFVYSNPFGATSSKSQYLRFLIDNGMEVGNHTATHRNLNSLTPEEVAKEIGSLHNEVLAASDYQTTSLALPYGGYPKTKENLESGEWEGKEYRNLGVLLVGAEPAPSPFSSSFNPMAIPRIQGSSAELDKWITNYEQYPAGRYVSDGKADVVTVRDTGIANLSDERVGELQVRAYIETVDAGAVTGANVESTH